MHINSRRRARTGLRNERVATKIDDLRYRDRRGRRASTGSCHPDVILLDEYRDDLVGRLRAAELPGDADLDLLAQEPDQLRAQGQGGDDRVVCAVGPRGGGSAWACPHDAADLRRWPAAMSPVCRTPATGRDNLNDRS